MTSLPVSLSLTNICRTLFSKNHSSTYVELYLVKVLSVFHPCTHGREAFWTLCRNQAHHHLVHIMMLGHLLKGKITCTNMLPRHLLTWKLMIVSLLEIQTSLGLEEGVQGMHGKEDTI